MKQIKAYINSLFIRHPLLMAIWIRTKYARGLKRTLRAQLRFKIEHRHGSMPASNSPRILVPQIETSHYQFYHMLVLAKALELRGAQVKVLLCGSRLDGCEIKSINNIHSRDPCVNCRLNHKNLVPIFQLDTVQVQDYVTDSEFRQLETIAIAVSKIFRSSIFLRELTSSQWSMIR